MNVLCTDSIAFGGHKNNENDKPYLNSQVDINQCGRVTFSSSERMEFEPESICSTSFPPTLSPTDLALCQKPIQIGFFWHLYCGITLEECESQGNKLKSFVEDESLHDANEYYLEYVYPNPEDEMWYQTGNRERMLSRIILLIRRCKNWVVEDLTSGRYVDYHCKDITKASFCNGQAQGILMRVFRDIN